MLILNVVNLFSHCTVLILNGTNNQIRNRQTQKEHRQPDILSAFKHMKREDPTDLFGNTLCVDIQYTLLSLSSSLFLALDSACGHPLFAASLHPILDS